ncbi:MAG: flagellar export protein FliJ [Bdellovibrionales bacterium]|nr:flagellar export protein FliJ [Bdellovibrionales bacterium]
MFKFKFSSLLKLKLQQMEQAQKEFSQAKKNFDEVMSFIASFYQSIETSREEILNLQKNQTFQVLTTIQEYEKFIEGQKIKIQQKRVVARELLQILEKKQMVLIEMATEFKKIEKLKEKQKMQFRKQQLKIETKQLDQIMIMRSGRGDKW